jgi:DUF4097 and DUF4098 domain-containing protein YvlB
MSTETFEQTFSVDTPAQLKVGNVRGTVDIRPGEEGIIEVTAVKHGNNDRTQIIIEQQDDGTVVAEAKYENSIANWFGLIKPNRVDFTIRVPKACSVKVNCVSSQAVIDGLEGDIDANAVSGKMQLSNLSGNFDFSSVSGKITADRISGPLQLNNVSGKVHISESQISTMIGKTVSGHVTVETPLTEGPYDFKSVSGNVSVITPEDTACTIRIKSVSGSAKVNLPVTSKSGTRNKQVVEVAGGGPEVSVKSVSGILKIGSPNYVKPEVLQPEMEVDHPKAEVQIANPKSQEKSQIQILQEIESGEISVEEALEQLNP